ncbi:MAG TPA: isoprenyl transferase [Deltaproteobacteria bacterium]|nr:isoprenyl transferase [Deltaproteobacteria bacterium]
MAVPRVEPARLPRHVAVIMDGNGRWATERGLPRARGHEAGAESVRVIVRACGELGIGALTLYSFSTENWARPDDEVEALMTLLATYLRDEREELMQNRVRLRGIGQLERLPPHVRALLAEAERLTADNDGLLLTLALSYGSRAEIVDAVRTVAREVQDGALEPDAIDEQTLTQRLYTAGTPDPDLLVRTSGEMRLSNFLLWQLAYAELYVTDVYWPDFRRPHLEVALAAYAGRQRRYGRTDAQVQGS